MHDLTPEVQKPHPWTWPWPREPAVAAGIGGMVAQQLVCHEERRQRALLTSQACVICGGGGV
jgi:hypothetical protein